VPIKDDKERPLRQDASDRVKDSRGTGETEFEKKRGINAVEVRRGLTRAYVSDLSEPVFESRLAVLRAVREAGLSIDFLKFAHGAMSFVADENDHDRLRAALSKIKAQVEIEGDCCIVSVHAVNMQDEEGLVARIVSEVIATGEGVDHVGDMHDRLLLVTDTKTGERLAKALAEKVGQ
jgi:aspartokinase